MPNGIKEQKSIIEALGQFKMDFQPLDGKPHHTP